ncbi:MAG: hypothetical protein QOK44_1110 [Betaproteobacteria bacterium]|jgi:hypothetical protein|nr:hypothetical protein [Betaproteobacteria bacterium]
MDLFRRNRRKIYFFQTTNVNTPHVLSSAWASERQNPAARTEIVFRNFRVPLVQRKFFDWREQTKATRGNSVNKGTSFATYRAITNTHMIKVRIHFKLDLAAVARTLVCLFHRVTPMFRSSPDRHDFFGLSSSNSPRNQRLELMKPDRIALCRQRPLVPRAA